MKKITTIFTLGALLFAGTVSAANPTATYIKSAEEVKLENELATLVYKSNVLKSQNRGSEVIIRFRVNDANQVQVLQVFGGDNKLSNSLQKQLNGKKLSAAQSSNEDYYARVRFQTAS
jgi:hypothetical protein